MPTPTWWPAATHAPRAGWEVQTQEYQLHSLWLAILQGQAFELRQILERLASWQVEAPAQQLFSDDAGKQVFASVGQEVQILLLQDYLNQLNWRLQPAAEVYRVALTLFKRAPQQAKLGLQLTLQALWRGDRPPNPIRRNPPSPSVATAPHR